MTRHFDESPPGRMNFREIAAEVRRRSGNRRKPSDIQIVNAIGQNAYRPHPLVPESLERLAWDGDDLTLSTADAETWMAHLVPHFAALQAEWDDAAAFRRGRKAFQRERLAHMRKVGYAAFEAAFKALHPERYTRMDVDGWLLQKYRETPDDIPEPDVAIPKKAKKPRPAPPPAFPADAPSVTVSEIKGRAGDKWRPMLVSGPDWITSATLRSGQLVRLIGAPDDKPETVAVVVVWPVAMNRADDKLIMKINEFHRGWGYQARMATGVEG